MKCVIILAVILGVSQAFSFGPIRGLQREVRVNGERRIFIRNASRMIIFNVPKNHPDYLEVVTIVGLKLHRKVVMDDKQNIIVDIRDSGAVEKSSQNEEEEDQIRPENQQMKILINIFRKYQGIAGEGAFYGILKEVKRFVDSHELSPIIYDVLRELEVQPNQVHVPKKNETEEKLEDVKEKVAARFEEAEHIKKERDDKFKVLEAMRVTQQVEWIQKLLAMKRYQHARELQSLMTQQEDPVKKIDSFIASTENYGDKNEADLRQMLIKTNIEEIQKEITGLQLIVQQLQNQQSFLDDQKHQMKMHIILGRHQGAQPDQMREINEAYMQLKNQEREVVAEQIRALKKIHELQVKLILQNQQLDTNLSKADY